MWLLFKCVCKIAFFPGKTSLFVSSDLWNQNRSARGFFARCFSAVDRFIPPSIARQICALGAPSVSQNRQVALFRFIPLFLPHNSDINWSAHDFFASHSAAKSTWPVPARVGWGPIPDARCTSGFAKCGAWARSRTATLPGIQSPCRLSPDDGL